MVRCVARNSAINWDLIISRLAICRGVWYIGGKQE